jgi:3-hydroxyisobutyrate dehydrogenase-like beta-hydroxyacid dehydrogenase
VLVEMSTIETKVIERIDDEAEGIEVADCPVIGPPPEAAAGTLTIVVGSSEEAYERLTPVLEPLCNSLHHVGDPGDANRIKLANNVMTFGNFAIAAEMIALVDHIGIDPEQFFEITSSGAAGSAIADLKMQKAFDEDFEAEFTVDNSRKDLGYALAMKEEADFSTPIAASVAEQYTFTSQVEGGHHDYSILVKAFSKDDD